MCRLVPNLRLNKDLTVLCRLWSICPYKQRRTLKKIRRCLDSCYLLTQMCSKYPNGASSCYLSCTRCHRQWRYEGKESTKVLGMCEIRAYCSFTPYRISKRSQVCYIVFMMSGQANTASCASFSGGPLSPHDELIEMVQYIHLDRGEPYFTVVCITECSLQF